MRILIFIYLFLPVISLAQKKQITLEDIYKKGTFRVDTVIAKFSKTTTDPKLPEALKDENGNLIGKPGEIIYNATHPRIVLLRTNIESIYRRSSKANVYVSDSLTKKAVTLDKGKVLHPTLSPDGAKVAYVKENNLYIKDL